MWWLWEKAWNAGSEAGQRAAAAGEWWVGALAGLALVVIFVSLIIVLIMGIDED